MLKYQYVTIIMKIYFIKKYLGLCVHFANSIDDREIYFKNYSNSRIIKKYLS